MSREMGRRTLRMSLTIGYPQTNSGEYPETHGRYASIRLEDEESCLIIADIDLTPAQWLMALSGSQVHVDAQVPTDLTRVGKFREVRSAKLGYVAEEDAERVAEAYRASGEWDLVTTGSRQGGRYVEMVRWVDQSGESIERCDECESTGVNCIAHRKARS